MQSFTVAPKAVDADFSETQRAIRQVLAAVPEAQLSSHDTHTGVAVLAVPTHEIKRVADLLGDRFFFDLNASLDY